ncbi:hypothetical protein MMC26_003458 [Xylographa opegraphella]|nr:hypothetical protein [Xylographa opegraphella]
MDSEPYRIAGRGGAGNYFSHEQIEAQKQNASKDVEAQASSEPIPERSIGRPPPKYALSGRGGLGNLFSPQEVSQAVPAATGSNPPTLVTASAKSSYSGRGGAGNYENNSRINEAHETTKRGEMADQTRKRVEAVTKEVEAELKAPERAHLAPEQSSEGD